MFERQFDIGTMESVKETESTELTSPIAKALRYLKVSKLSEIEVILFGK